MGGESFGLPSSEHRWLLDDHMGYTPPDLTKTLQGGPHSIFEALSSESRQALEEWQWSVVMHSGVFYPELKEPAERYILTAITNDALSLVRLIDLVEGRAAALISRTMFEHLVNFISVHTGPDQVRDRFMDHRHVTAMRLGQRKWHLQLLEGKECRKESNLLDGLIARAKRPMAEALEKYTTAFKGSWSDKSLKDRADEHELSEEYESYRMLSGVVHGASGSLRGLIREIKGSPMHRIGQDMELAGVAYEEGLRFYYQFLRKLREIAPRPESEELEGRTLDLLWRTGEVRRVLKKADRSLQPSESLPPSLVAVLGIWPSEKHRWYIHDLRTNEIALAEPPNPEPDLGEVREAARDHPFEQFNNRPMSLAFPGVTVVPKKGATWSPAEALLVPATHPARESKPRRVR